MSEKEKNILIIATLITILFNFMIISNYYNIGKIVIFFIIVVSIYFSVFIGLGTLATYMFIQEKDTKLVVMGIISVILSFITDLALITLFEIQIINMLAIVLFIIDVFCCIRMINKK